MSMIDEYISCPSHCCMNHGCKYGLAGCPVEGRKVPQEHPCEACTDGLSDVYIAGQMGMQVTVGYRRDDGSMESIPTEEEILAAVEQALLGLDLGKSWSITLVDNPS